MAEPKFNVQQVVALILGLAGGTGGTTAFFKANAVDAPRGNHDRQVQVELRRVQDQLTAHVGDERLHLHLSKRFDRHVESKKVESDRTYEQWSVLIDTVNDIRLDVEALCVSSRQCREGRKRR